MVVGFEGRREGSLVELRGLREDLVGGRRRSLGLGLRNVRGGGGGFRRIRDMFFVFGVSEDVGAGEEEDDHF